MAHYNTSKYTAGRPFEVPAGTTYYSNSYLGGKHTTSKTRTYYTYDTLVFQNATINTVRITNTSGNVGKTPISDHVTFYMAYDTVLKLMGISTSNISSPSIQTTSTKNLNVGTPNFRSYYSGTDIEVPFGHTSWDAKLAVGMDFDIRMSPPADTVKLNNYKPPINGYTVRIVIYRNISEDQAEQVFVHEFIVEGYINDASKNSHLYYRIGEAVGSSTYTYKDDDYIGIFVKFNRTDGGAENWSSVKHYGINSRPDIKIHTQPTILLYNGADFRYTKTTETASFYYKVATQSDVNHNARVGMVIQRKIGSGPWTDISKKIFTGEFIDVQIKNSADVRVDNGTINCAWNSAEKVWHISVAGLQTNELNTSYRVELTDDSGASTTTSEVTFKYIAPTCLITKTSSDDYTIEDNGEGQGKTTYCRGQGFNIATNIKTSTQNSDNSKDKTGITYGVYCVYARDAGITMTNKMDAIWIYNTKKENHNDPSSTPTNIPFSIDYDELVGRRLGEITSAYNGTVYEIKRDLYDKYKTFYIIVSVRLHDIFGKTHTYYYVNDTSSTSNPHFARSHGHYSTTCSLGIKGNDWSYDAATTRYTPSYRPNSLVGSNCYFKNKLVFWINDTSIVDDGNHKVAFFSDGDDIEYPAKITKNQQLLIVDTSSLDFGKTYYMTFELYNGKYMKRVRINTPSGFTLKKTGKIDLKNLTRQNNQTIKPYTSDAVDQISLAWPFVSNNLTTASEVYQFNSSDIRLYIRDTYNNNTQELCCNSDFTKVGDTLRSPTIHFATSVRTRDAEGVITNRAYYAFKQLNGTQGLIDSGINKTQRKITKLDLLVCIVDNFGDANYSVALPIDIDFRETSKFKITKIQYYDDTGTTPEWVNINFTPTDSTSDGKTYVHQGTRLRIFGQVYYYMPGTYQLGVKYTLKKQEARELVAFRDGQTYTAKDWATDYDTTKVSDEICLNEKYNGVVPEITIDNGVFTIYPATNLPDVGAWQGAEVDNSTLYGAQFHTIKHIAPEIDFTSIKLEDIKTEGYTKVFKCIYKATNLNYEEIKGAANTIEYKSSIRLVDSEGNDVSQYFTSDFQHNLGGGTSNVNPNEAPAPTWDVRSVCARFITTITCAGKSIEKVDYSKYFVVYNNVATLSYRKNKIGINTNGIDEETEKETVFMIKQGENGHVVKFIGVGQNGDKLLATLNLKTMVLESNHSIPTPDTLKTDLFTTQVDLAKGKITTRKKDTNNKETVAEIDLLNGIDGGTY